MSAAWKMSALLTVLCLSLSIYAVLLKAQRDQARESASLWEASAASQAAALKDLQAAREKVETALTEREDELDRLSRSRDAERRTFKEAQRADKVVDDWSHMRLPDAVRGLLRQGRPHGRCDS